MPFVGILTSRGSFSSVIPPFLDQKSPINISWKLPYGIDNVDWMKTGSEIFAYHDKNEIIFLYTDAKQRAVKFNIDTSSHRKISNSVIYKIWAHYPVGIRINHFFWTFGGVRTYSSAPIAVGAGRQGILMTRFVLECK